MKKKIIEMQQEIFGLQKKNVPSFILLSITQTTIYFCIVFLLCLKFTTFLTKVPFTWEIPFRFQSYQSDSMYKTTLLVNLLLFLPLQILNYVFSIVVSKKILEYFLTNFLFFYIISCYQSGAFISGSFFLYWIVTCLMIVLSAEKICLNLERRKEYTFNGMLDLSRKKYLEQLKIITLFIDLRQGQKRYARGKRFRHQNMPKKQQKTENQNINQTNTNEQQKQIPKQEKQSEPPQKTQQQNKQNQQQTNTQVNDNEQEYIQQNLENDIQDLEQIVEEDDVQNFDKDEQIEKTSSDDDNDLKIEEENYIEQDNTVPEDEAVSEKDDQEQTQKDQNQQIINQEESDEQIQQQSQQQASQKSTKFDWKKLHLKLNKTSFDVLDKTGQYIHNTFLPLYQKAKQDHLIGTLFNSVLLMILFSKFLSLLGLCQKKPLGMNPKKDHSDYKLDQIIQNIKELKSSVKSLTENEQKLLKKIDDMKMSIEMQTNNKEDEHFDFFEQNLTDVWKEIGQIKGRLNENDQSQFTNLNSLNNELKTNKKKEENFDSDSDKNDQKNQQDFILEPFQQQQKQTDSNNDQQDKSNKIMTQKNNSLPRMSVQQEQPKVQQNNNTEEIEQKIKQQPEQKDISQPPIPPQVMPMANRKLPGRMGKTNPRLNKKKLPTNKPLLPPPVINPTLIQQEDKQNEQTKQENITNIIQQEQTLQKEENDQPQLQDQQQSNIQEKDVNQENNTPENLDNKDENLNDKEDEQKQEVDLTSPQQEKVVETENPFQNNQTPQKQPNLKNPFLTEKKSPKKQIEEDTMNEQEVINNNEDQQEVIQQSVEQIQQKEPIQNTETPQQIPPIPKMPNLPKKKKPTRTKIPKIKPIKNSLPNFKPPSITQDQQKGTQDNKDKVYKVSPTSFFYN